MGSTMQAMRKFFGWLFAVCSVMAFSVAVSFLYRDLTRVQSFRALLPGGILLLFCFVSVMAWWTTWRDRHTARVWGILASLQFLIPPIVLHFLHIRFAPSSGWQVPALSTMALIAYAWPDPEAEESSMLESGDHDSID